MCVLVLARQRKPSFSNDDGELKKKQKKQKIQREREREREMVNGHEEKVSLWLREN